MLQIVEKEKIVHTVLELQKMVQCELVLTGSLALEFHGFDTGDVKDRDLDVIIISPSINVCELIKSWEQLFPANKHKVPKDSYTGKKFPHVEVIAQCYWQEKDINVDFFTEPCTDEKLYPSEVIYCYMAGIRVKKLPLIIEAKKRFNRKKDWDQINFLMRQFLPQNN